MDRETNDKPFRRARPTDEWAAIERDLRRAEQLIRRVQARLTAVNREHQATASRGVV